MSFDIRKKWKYIEFKNWLKDLSVQECWSYDWKAIIDLDSKNLRSSFCAFANTNGGCIFFGVDKKKNIIGVEEDQELRTKINRVINSNILPPVPINNWDITTIKIPRKKLVVYAVYILRSLNFEKPHITEYKIYIRGNGENIPLNDGGVIRRLFLIEKFQPEHIYQLENELDKIKNCRFSPDEIDFVYLKQMKEYLEKQARNSREFGELLNTLARIIRFYEEIKKRQARARIRGENLMDLDSDPVVKLSSDLSKELDDFYIDFKKIHKLQ